MRVDASDGEVARRVERMVLAEADRLEGVLSVFRVSSEFSRWRRGEVDAAGPDVCAVLRVAADWFAATAGAFNPCLASVFDRWRRAEAEQVLPDAEELAELARRATLPFTVDGERVDRQGDCSCVDVHGVAKGWVVDRLVDVAVALDGVTAVLVDVGGDLRHARRDAMADAMVGVENPFAVGDNEPPLTVIRVADRAVASSGGGRRGWRIGDRWFGHLLDPVTGWPLAVQRSATVVAASAADADAAALAVVVGGLAAVDGHDVAVLLVGEDGVVSRNDAWRASVVEVQ